MQVLFRADGNSNIGLGHIVRSLALAEMLQPSYQCLFAVQEPSEAIIRQIKNSGCELITLPNTTDYLEEAKTLAQRFGNQFSTIILDGYQFTTAYQQELRPFFKLICIDDLHTIHFVADAIINPAGGITEPDYSKEVYTKLYTGPEYALLRKPFLKAATALRSFPDEPRVFINMGGADPGNHTVQVIQQLLQRPENFWIEVVVGSAFKDATELEELAKNNSQITIHKQLTAQEMCNLMQVCSLAVLPPSTVAYEWCSVGGPLLLIRTADNQKNLEEFLLNNQLALPFSELNNFLPVALYNGTFFSEQLKKQRMYFDGQSPARLCQIFDQLFYSELLQLRSAQAEDLQLLFHWINDPVVRKFSLNPDQVPLATHTAWYQYKLTDKNCFIFIAEVQKEPVGMIRFDINQSEAIISYLIDKNFRGKGLGTLMLQEGILKLLKNFRSVTSISGLVQQENIASIKAFTKAGFSVNPEPDQDYPNVLKFTMLT